MVVKIFEELWAIFGSEEELPQIYDSKQPSNQTLVHIGHQWSEREIGFDFSFEDEDDNYNWPPKYMNWSIFHPYSGHGDFA